MKLFEALGLQQGEVAAFVGAGGKTTAIWRVQAELAGEGAYVVSTTTTKIMEPVLPPNGVLYLAVQPDPGRLQGLLDRAPRLTLAARRRTEPYPTHADHPVPSRPYKLDGLPPETVDGLITQLPGITWLVEADGAKGAGLKVPAAHEPVIPRLANLVVVMAHLAVLGRALDETTVHRAIDATRLLDVQKGTLLTPEMFVRILGDEALWLKGVPDAKRPQVRVVALLTQPSPQLYPDAQALAGQLLRRQNRYSHAVIAALRAEQPVLAVVTR